MCGLAYITLKNYSIIDLDENLKIVFRDARKVKRVSSLNHVQKYTKKC